MESIRNHIGDDMDVVDVKFSASNKIKDVNDLWKLVGDEGLKKAFRKALG